jgi:hypothetical protein
MENEYKDMFEYLQKNELGVSSLNISLVKNRDLNDPNTLIEVKEIIDRYENNSSNKYSEDIMIQLRQRRGLEKYDISEDEEINNMNKEKIFEALFGWNGLRGWDYTIKNWIKEVYGIELDSESEEE